MLGIPSVKKNAWYGGYIATPVSKALLPAGKEGFMCWFNKSLLIMSSGE